MLKEQFQSCLQLLTRSFRRKNWGGGGGGGQVDMDGKGRDFLFP